MPPQVPLEVGSFIVRDFRMRTNEDFDDAKPSSGGLDVDFDVYLYPETTHRYYIVMSIACGGEDIVAANEAYGIDLLVIGTFQFKDEDAVNAHKRMIIVNAPSILYGCARGYVATVTGAGAHGVFTLPSVNLLEVAKKKYGKPRENDVSDSTDVSADAEPTSST